VVDVRDIIICVKFGDDRLRLAVGEVYFFPWTLMVVLIITLPCERVIFAVVRIRTETAINVLQSSSDTSNELGS